MRKIKVSILIACNSSTYLRETIKSIENQTFDHNLIEIILVLDRLEKKEIILELLNATKINLQIFQSQIPGVVHATNLGLDKAIGDFIAVIDSDDVMLPDRIKNQIEFLEENPEIVAVGGHIQLINENGNVIGEKKYNCSPTKIRRNIFEMAQLAHPATTYRREFIIFLGGYRDLSAPDLDLWIRVLEKSNLANIDEQVIQYRMHQNNFSKQSIFNTNIPKQIVWISHFLRINKIAHDLPQQGEERIWIKEKTVLLEPNFLIKLALSESWHLSLEFMDLLHVIKTRPAFEKVNALFRITANHKHELSKRIILRIRRLMYKLYLHKKHNYKRTTN